MATLPVGTVLPTSQEFIAHWTSANTELGATPLTLQGGYTVAQFTTDRTAYDTALTAVETAANAVTNAAADRDLKKLAIRARLTQFRGAVTGVLMGSIYAKSAPRLPGLNVSEGRYLKPFDDMATLWGQINAAPPAGFTGPLTLVGGYTLALFQAELAALKTAFNTYKSAVVNAKIARQRRDLLLPNLLTRMQQYRAAVPFRLPATSALVGTVPTVYPPDGSTPDPVNLSATWTPATSKATLNWTISDATDFAAYSVRYVSGGTYKTAEEAVVPGGNITNKNTLTFQTDIGLVVAGSVTSFKVYVVTTTGNEKGSNAVKVTRT